MGYQPRLAKFGAGTIAPEPDVEETDASSDPVEDVDECEECGATDGMVRRWGRIGLSSVPNDIYLCKVCAKRWEDL